MVLELIKKLKFNGSQLVADYCVVCLRDLMHGIKVVIGKDHYCSRCASEYFKVK